MKSVISSAAMRVIDHLTVEKHDVPSLVLMENAARAVAGVVLETFSGDVSGKAILTLCGPGNNGGDGAAVARILALMGANVDVILFGHFADTKGDARLNFELLQRWPDGPERLKETLDPKIFDPTLFKNSSGTLNFAECNSSEEWDKQVSQLQKSPAVIIDALFGTGLRRPLEGIQRAAVRFLYKLSDPHKLQPGERPLIVSIDIPSGLNSDLAEAIGDAVRADVTVTMTAPKPANVLAPASIYNGELIVADIGSPSEVVQSSRSNLLLIEETDARDWLVRTRYTPDSYKNTHGHALIIAGSRGYTGAAVLCGSAALRAGAGLVTIATPVSAQPTIAALAIPEIMTAALSETDRGGISEDALDYALMLAGKANVVAIGPGLTATDERTRNFVRSFIERRRFPVVIDADALNALAPWPAGLRGSVEYPLILTPHQGEMLRLMGTAEKSHLADRVAATRNFATTHQVILLLKGTRSLIAAPDGRVFVNPTGNAGLGTAGCGDTLTGLITGFLAQTSALKNAGPGIALETVIAALYVGGLAGDLAAQSLGMRTMLASDVRDHFSAAIRSLDPEGELP